VKSLRSAHCDVEQQKKRQDEGNHFGRDAKSNNLLPVRASQKSDDQTGCERSGKDENRIIGKHHAGTNTFISYFKTFQNTEF
jgi:hypothetical protein